MEQNVCQQQPESQLDLFHALDCSHKQAMRDYERQVNQQIGALIRALRRKRGLTQKALGDMLGLTYQQIQKYESGKSSISVGKLFLSLRAINYLANSNIFEKAK